jgi:hypothetical protein
MQDSLTYNSCNFHITFWVQGDYNHATHNIITACYICGFGGLVVSMLASGTQDRGFTPGRSHRIFWAKKSFTSLPLEGK